MKNQTSSTIPTRRLAVLVAAAALVLAACGGDDDSTGTTGDTAASSAAPSAAPSTDTTPDPTPDPRSAATAGGDAAAATLTIQDFAFSGVTEVAVGTTVIVTNEDATSHTWTAVDGTFDSGTLAPGDSFEFTFDTAGEFAYFCAIHPAMSGTIVVTG